MKSQNQLNHARSFSHTFILGIALVAIPFSSRGQCPQICDGYPTYNTGFGSDVLQYDTTGYSNMGVGLSALNQNTTGFQNTAAGNYALFFNKQGSNNTVTGFFALFSNDTGYDNTATGYSALSDNQNGALNTAIGYEALFHNTETGNSAIGSLALYSNTSGTYNTASGANALYANTTGYDNTASGESGLYANTTGHDNTANGVAALYSNSTGYFNTASGGDALFYNSTGYGNTASGASALQFNTTGSSNTAVGNSALFANTTGGSNIAIGDSAGINLTTGSNNIDIGNKGVAGEGNTLRIGKKGTQTATYISGIRGTTVAGGIGVLVDSNGRLGTTTSSARFKEAIKPMEKASEAILSLQPVTFHYKKELDPTGIPQFGLVAEQVEKVDPDLVVRDEEGKPYSVRYEAVNAMLLNEFLKEHWKVDEQTRKQRELETTVARLQAQLQEVRNEIHASKLSPRLASASE